MDPILVIENDPHDPLGRLGDAIEARGLQVDVVRPADGETVPDLDGYAAVVVLGGPQGAYEAAEHPYLDVEMDLIRASVARNVPLLGICLGSQLIAHALGGRAYRAPKPEAAVIEPHVTAEGERDPLGHHLRKPVLTFHQDTFDVPPGSAVLARSDLYTMVFRCGSALAVQPHPEVKADFVEHWVANSDIPTRAGADAEALLRQVRDEIDPSDAMALFDAWLDDIPKAGH